MRGSREDRGGGGCESGPPGKSKIAESFLRNTGTDPLGFKCYSRDLRTSVKYVGDKKQQQNKHTHTHTHTPKSLLSALSGPPDRII